MDWQTLLHGKMNLDVTSLGFRLLSSISGWEPALNSGEAGAELVHGD